MLTETFNHLLNEYGKDVYLNDETTSRKALINSTSVTSSYKENFDDHIIHTNFPIQRGDTITINNEIFIVVSDVQLKSDYEYKATIRPCDQTIEVIVIEQKLIGYDDMGRPVYENTEVPYDIPAYIDWQRLAIDGTQIRVSDQEIDIVVQDNEQTQTIVVNDEFDLLGKRYAVDNINKFRQGLLILRSSIVLT